jgi:hypothetical protein
MSPLRVLQRCANIICEKLLLFILVTQLQSAIASENITNALEMNGGQCACTSSMYGTDCNSLTVCDIWTTCSGKTCAVSTPCQSLLITRIRISFRSSCRATHMEKKDKMFFLGLCLIHLVILNQENHIRCQGRKLF